MRVIGLVACVTLGFLTGCHKPEPEIELPPIDDTEPVAVRFGVSVPDITVTTKTDENSEEWSGYVLRIIGVERGGRLNMNESYFIDNLAVWPPEENETYIDIKKGDGSRYFYPKDEDNKDVILDFYGYCHDGAATDYLRRNEDSIEIPIKIKDGSKDILAVKASPEYDILNCTDSRGAEVQMAQAYSAYAARRGVQPTLEFKHMLTRFRLFIVDGNKGRSEHPVVLTDLRMDTKKEGVLQIAPEQKIKVTEGQTKGYVKLASPPSYIVPDPHYFDTDNPQTQYSFNLMPGEESHKIYVKMEYVNEADKDRVIEPLKLELKASDIKTPSGDKITRFAAGHRYDIAIIVYGAEEVELTPHLLGWEDVESPEIEL